MPTSAQIRQQFLDFFREKQHTLVPSSSLLPDSPNLLFTNAGMNQFVPIFLGERAPDVDQWSGAIKGSPTRAADTQKCIRAGGKHNDLDDVGLDTYHHTFFEMLGNWSFGDYFKKEAIAWSWELIVERFHFPPDRVYATIYQPDPGDPSERDQEAYDLWAEKFRSVGLDPAVHIVNGNKKDNFWMMGETGPCGPCSEIHIDLTPEDRTPELELRGAKMVNAGVPECIEIWNNVFIQFNAQPRAAAAGRVGAPPAESGVSPDGLSSTDASSRPEDRLGETPKPAGGTPTLPEIEFVPLAQQHVDTGMGFERLTSIIQGTKNFSDFANAKISNYETDIFRPIFDELEKMSGKTYRSTLPSPGETPGSRADSASFPPASPAFERKISNSTEKTIISDEETPANAFETASDEEKGVSDSEKGISSLDKVISAADKVISRAEQVISDPGKVISDLQKVSSGAQQVISDPQNVILRSDVGFSGGEVEATEGPESLDQIAIDVAFRVIADHIRTLSFAIADGISPGNTDRNYVLRRILRRAVRYGRTLGFTEPFFYKLVAVLARTMGDVFPEIRTKQKHVEEVLKREEEAFNRTLDKGIALFEAEAGRLAGTAASASGRVGVPPAGLGVSPERTSATGGAPALVRKAATQDASLGGQDAHPTRGATYTRRRRLPHFEQPWAIYALTISTSGHRKLTPAARTIVLDALRHFHRARYELFAACVMPDHVHMLLQPWVKEQNDRGEAVFWPLGDLMHSIKSFTAKEINKAEGTTGTVWEQERFDRYVRGDRDLEEKFRYILGNPAREGLGEEYPWVWSIEDSEVCSGSEVPSGETPKPAGGTPTLPAHSTPASSEISGAFAFQLYDTFGFPLDLTELMARERGLTVDVAGFETHMAEQRARARAAQKKTVIELSEIETKTPTNFIGYDQLCTHAKVVEVVALKDKTAVILDTTTAYAEMGGQVGDTGELVRGADTWRIANTQKSGATWLHFLEGVDAPEVGSELTFEVELRRRRAIERHHSVTHLLHWALHEIVSHEATQKGSFVGPDKLTFDFNSAALAPGQVRDIERLVNEKIVENAAIGWIEVPYAEVRGNPRIMQFFGDKYGETVRVVQIGGAPAQLDGYSMELCAGTHTRATGEIGLFRIQTEAAIAAGVRRIEAVAGLNAYDFAAADAQRLHALAAKVGTPLPELEKRLEGLLAQQKELERALKSAQQREAAGRARDLLATAETLGAGGIPAILADLGAADGDTLQTVADALKARGFVGVVVLGGTAAGAVALVATVGPAFTGKVQAGKIIGAIAPLVGGKGGGKAEAARGGGKDPSQLAAALAKARELLS